MSASRSRWWSPRASRRRRTPPNWSRSTTRSWTRSPTCARRLRAGAPQLLPEAPGNVAIDWPGPVPDDGSNAREIEAIFSGAAHVARVSAVNQRLVVATMEPRGATARYDAASDSYTLRSCSQGAGPQRDQLVAMMGWPKRKAARHHRGCRRRVRAEDRGLSGISEPARRREAHRPAGRLDGDALGVVPLRSAGARHRHRSRACDRPEGQVPRAAGASTSPAWAPSSACPARTSRPTISRAASPACTRSRASRSTCSACSPTRCRPAPIAAPGGRRRTTRWSGWSTRPRASPASIRSGCGGAI